MERKGRTRRETKEGSEGTEGGRDRDGIHERVRRGVGQGMPERRRETQVYLLGWSVKVPQGVHCIAVEDIPPSRRRTAFGVGIARNLPSIPTKYVLKRPKG